MNRKVHWLPSEVLILGKAKDYVASRLSVKQIQRSIVSLLKKHGVVRAGLFGSVVRGEPRKNSDIDILIEFRGKKSLLDLVALKLELERKLKRNVDLAEYAAVHPLLKDRILKEEVKII